MLQRILWLALGLVHLIPALAFFRPAALTELYRIPAHDPMFLLLQHRAGLFVAVLVVCVWAAFHPETRRLASVVVAISMVSFLGLYFANGSPPLLRRIALVDLAGLPVLAAAAFLAFRPTA